MNHKPVEGFSKMSKEGKIEWLVNEYLNGSENAIQTLKQYWSKDADLQQLHDEFSENTLSNFFMPFGFAPNFLIDGELHCLPMAIEESSVVAAASKAAKFWIQRGGFKTQILSKVKLGHVHFMFSGDKENLEHFFIETVLAKLFIDTEPITKNMQARGGGILNLKLVDKTSDIPDYFQIHAEFDTVDSMGANFINSCLEQFAQTLKREVNESESFTKEEKESLQIVMCILSNYTPDNIVRAEVSCKVEDLSDRNVSSEEFVEKFTRI